MARFAFFLFVSAAAVSVTPVDGQEVADKRPTKIWNRTGPLADDYHVYGLDWGKDELKFYVDGVLVRSVENTHWHQSLFLIFDSETMPEWFGMPDDKDLPSTFNVEYVRAWKVK